MLQIEGTSRKHSPVSLTLLLVLLAFSGYAQTISLGNAFAHNDYWHKRPLYDAMDKGYVNIEADIYLRRGDLIVAHVLPFLKNRKTNTLEKLYLEPLLGCIRGTNTRLKCPDYPVMLMIDIKSDAEKTYRALGPVLEKYRDILTSCSDGVMTRRQVTIVLTGHRPYTLLNGQGNRLAFVDADLLRENADQTAGIYQTASCRYSKILRWTGTGMFPEHERKKLAAYVSAAHAAGRKVRLWASPENHQVWAALLSCGVDLINTDRLAALRDFLLTGQTRLATATTEKKP